METFWSYWYFHLPNYILAALIYTLLGRLLLSFFAPADWQNYIWRAFCRVTDPILWLVGLVTPRILHGIVLLPIAAAWVALVRTVLFLTLLQLGYGPPVGGPSS